MSQFWHYIWQIIISRRRTYSGKRAGEEASEAFSRQARWHDNEGRTQRSGIVRTLSRFFAEGSKLTAAEIV